MKRFNYKGIEIANNKELAKYLGITNNAIRKRKKVKELELMRLGLILKNNLDYNVKKPKKIRKFAEAYEFINAI